MDLETRRFDFTELSNSLPKCAYSSYFSESTASNDNSLQNLTSTKELNVTDLETSLLKSILQDDKAQLIALAKRLLFEGDSDHRASIIDRSSVSKLLHLCCVFDSVECASSLINGEVGAVPLVNEIDETGKSPLHSAAEAHAVRCVELLLKKRSRTDLKTKDGHAQLALELSLSSTGMDVIWNPDDYSVEDLLVLLSEKDLTAVKLLCEKTKEIDEVAHASAIGGRIVALALMLIVAAEKVNESILVLHDADLGSKEKTTIYECVIKEALSLGRTPTKSETTEKRKLLLSEIELLQLFGAAVSQGGCTDKKVTSPLILACQAGDETVIELLLKTDIDVNDVDAEGNSALHWSLKSSRRSCLQQIKIVWLLLEHGARVSQRNKLGLTALHIAASNGDSQALQVLLLEEPDCINSKTEMKETPLFFAVKDDHMDCAELLLRWGANSEVLNLRKQRPIDLAKSQDMRFMLNPTNISLMNRAFPIQRKYTTWLQGGEVISETCDELLTMTDEGTTTERISSSTRTEICKYFESPSGCVRGAKCFYAHGEEELRQMKQGKHSVHSPAARELKRKIFVGGLPPSADSDLLTKFFEEQFGSVEDAVVAGVHMGNQLQSRGFGFVTFKHEKSVSVAVQAHYVNIMGKQVEIKSAVPASLLVAEFQKLSPQKPEQGHNDLNQPKVQKPSKKTMEENPTWETTEETKHEQKTWVDRLLYSETKICSNESQGHISTGFVDQSMPAWLRTFKKWLPRFLKEASKHPREGEYPLSSLKGDFRAAFGLELDHVALGYSKLSDFMRSFPDLCSMKVVPIGKCGPANHMVLLPTPFRPHWKLLQPLTMPSLPSHATSIDISGDGISNDSKSSQDLMLVSNENAGFVSCCTEDGNQSHKATEENSAQKDTAPSDHSRFIQFLKPDPLFHARPWLYNGSDGGSGNSDDEEGWAKGFKCTKLRHQQRHLVLEALARKWNSSSVFFLREFDFYENYDASLEQKICFGCKQNKMQWANHPCLHKLWCSVCKRQAEQAAGDFEHKCVVCDARVQKIDLIPPNGWWQPSYKNAPIDEEFPPLNSSLMQTPSKKKKAP